MRLSPAILSAACLIGLTVAAPATAGAGAQTPSAPLREPLPAWLAGTWAMEKGAAWSDQVWTSTRGGIMLGTTRIGFGPDVESWAMMRIERRRDGSLILIVQPEAAASAEFPMVLASATSIEFANPRHDFPQRIRYRREGQLLMTEAAKLDGGDSVQTNYRPVESAPAD